MRALWVRGEAQATTPLDPRVLDAMLPFYTEQYGNPHSRTHAYGWDSEEAVEQAREVHPPSFGYFTCVFVRVSVCLLFLLPSAMSGRGRVVDASRPSVRPSLAHSSTG